MLLCPVCKGQEVLRLLPSEAAGWNDGAIDSADVLVDYVEQKCWACGGTGQIRIENRGVALPRFEEWTGRVNRAPRNDERQTTQNRRQRAS
jgi:hypothetical protein